MDDEILTEVREYLAATLDSYCLAARANPDQTEIMVEVAEHFRALINEAAHTTTTRT